jgi:BirA family biotin operon repressor/biotin-[acetyl-CoA-carboxylase] ligase
MLFTQLVQANLKTRTLGRTIEYYPRLGSTNTEAWSLLAAGAHAGTVVVTDHQTAGRGRGGHTWQASPDRSLTFSLILTPDEQAHASGLFPLLAGVAVSVALERFGLTARLKWPNDVLLGDRKAGGILCESKISAGKIRALVCGIGLNVNETETDFPEDLRPHVTSLYLASGRYHQRELILAEILNVFEQFLDQYRAQGSPAIVSAWKQRCAHWHRTVTFHAGNHIFTGKFTGLTSRGEALIAVDGAIRRFAGGAVIAGESSGD